MPLPCDPRRLSIPREQQFVEAAHDAGHLADAARRKQRAEDEGLGAHGALVEQHPALAGLGEERLDGERLVLRHEGTMSAKPFVFGSLLAARRIGRMTGVVRGLDKLLFAGN